MSSTAASASGQPAETSDPVIIKTKTAIAAKLDHPVFAELPANERTAGPEYCYQLARAAGAICYDPVAGERLDCQKARTRLRECFEHIPPGTLSETTSRVDYTAFR